MAKVTEYLGIESSGRTLTEARQESARRATQIVEFGPPAVVQCNGITAIYWRSAYGAEYAVIDGATREGQAYCHCCVGATHEADPRQYVLFALAQRSYGSDGWEFPDGLTDKGLRSELISWVEFQTRFAEAKARGVPDADCYDYASRNHLRPELWEATV